MTSVPSRQNTIASLEQEVNEMHAKLRLLQESLSAARNDVKVMGHVVDTVEENRFLTGTLTKRGPAAESAERSFVTLKGMSKWKPFIVSETQLSFQYIGLCPKSCIAMSFQISSLKPVKCVATVESKLFQNHGSLSAKQLGSVSSFIQARVNALCDAACQQQLQSPHEISSLLRSLDWELGRLEHTASELAQLKRRYQAYLTPAQLPNSSHFQLEIEFAGQSRSAKLRATFEISEDYPFSPLNVCLDTFDEQVDVEAIRKLLIKNAKPGYGYLSRTCDVIAAFLQ